MTLKVIVIETGAEFQIPEGWEFVDASIESYHTRVLIRKQDDE
jgi:hypothetical protein